MDDFENLAEYITTGEQSLPKGFRLLAFREKISKEDLYFSTCGKWLQSPSCVDGHIVTNNEVLWARKISNDL